MGATLHGLGHNVPLPFPPILVCTPDYTLGTFSAVDDLLACFPRPAALHTFSSTTSLVRPDIFLRLPPATNFTGQPVEGRTDFVSLTPATALEALLTARKTTYEQCPSSRESVEAGSLTADLHFALYCTPYYGYTPASESDFIAMTYALSDFLVYTCFTTTGEPNAALSNLSARPGDLLTILSTIHPAFLSVSPGAALGPGTEKYVSGIFQQAWALGPHARAYLNSSQLPLRYFRRADELQAHTHTRAHGTEFGGYGAKQYHFVFSPDTHDKVSFADLPVTPNALPDNFLSDFLALENWPSAATLLTKPNNTICWPDNASLRMWHHLGHLILLIIAPHDTDDAPPFLQHPEIYGIEFWHAHLNYACTRFAVSHGPDRLLGNQICHWTTGTSETCMKVTHLVVFLPPALGAYVLSRHRTKVSSSLSSADDISMQDGPHTLRINQSALLTPPAVLKHQAEQITNARSRAAEGSLAPYTIPLLANTQVRSSKNRVAWTLKFTLPTPAEEGTTQRVRPQWGTGP